jgi:hypothetical protein
MLSGKIVNTKNFEISHFVTNDNQLFIYLGGVGWGGVGAHRHSPQQHP